MEKDNRGKAGQRKGRLRKGERCDEVVAPLPSPRFPSVDAPVPSAVKYILLPYHEIVARSGLIPVFVLAQNARRNPSSFCLPPPPSPPLLIKRPPSSLREREREILDDAIVLPPHQKDSEGREEGTRVTDGRMPASQSPNGIKSTGKKYRRQERFTSQ